MEKANTQHFWLDLFDILKIFPIWYQKKMNFQNESEGMWHVICEIDSS